MPLPVIVAARNPSYSSSLNEDSEISPAAMARQIDLASATEVSVDIIPVQSQSSRAVDQARGVPHAKSAADLVNKIKQMCTVSQSTMDHHDSDSFVVP